MKVTLNDNPLLNKDNLSYAEEIESGIIDPETLRLAQKYSFNIHDLILIGTKPLSLYKGDDDKRRLLLLKFILGGKRIYFNRILSNGDCYEFAPPEQINFELEHFNNKSQKLNKKLNKKQKNTTVSKAHSKKINSYLEQINRETTVGFIKAAKRDFDFVIHFNTEMFYQNLIAKGQCFTKETAIAIYCDERYTKIIDLSDSRERMGFITLYAITFYGLRLEDLYSIDSIFSLDVNRESDEKKRLAGQEVFNLVFNENRNDIQKAAFMMGEALKNLPLPEININVNSLIKKNYTLYCGIGDMGRAFSRLILSLDKSFGESVKTARRISFYKMMEKYYDELLRQGEVSDKSNIYKSVTAFSNAAAGKGTAGELDFAVRGMKHFPVIDK
jgi:hypothetical protein